jgi:molybdate transport system substrate-binding protein
MPDGDSRFTSLLLISSVLVSACERTPVTTEPVRIAAAADLTLAFEELGRMYEAQSGQRVRLSFGASGVLAKQLAEGAPLDLFAAASASFVEEAVRSGACDATTRARYGLGHLVVWSARGELPLSTLRDLADPLVKRIAIANPDHAPYGRAAREALVRAGLWTSLEGKVVQADNVRQALQFAETGSADAAIVARSLLRRPNRGKELAIDPSLHAPIEQTLVVCRHGKSRAGGQAFAKLVASPDGQALLERYGFGAARDGRSR